MVDPLLAAKISYVTGIINVVFFIFIFLSCRCTPVHLPKKLRDSSLYKKIYNYHCYIWWFLLISLVFHVLFAIFTFGNPF